MAAMMAAQMEETMVVLTVDLLVPKKAELLG